jgi:hypothetical protein
MLGGMTRTHTALVLFWVTTACLLFGASCVLSPKPEPPMATIDVGEVFLDPPTYGTARTIKGGPGAVEPAGAILRATNLDSDFPVVQREVEDDGSFELTIELEFIDESEIRLQVIDDEVRSDPVDVVLSLDDNSIELAQRALDDCLILDPSLELDLEESESIAVSNDCGEDVVLEPPRLRRAFPGVQVGAEHSWPLVLGDGESIEMSVDFEPDSDGELVVFLEASSPESDRRPVTLVFPR